MMQYRTLHENALAMMRKANDPAQGINARQHLMAQAQVYATLALAEVQRESK